MSLEFLRLDGDNSGDGHLCITMANLPCKLDSHL